MWDARLFPCATPPLTAFPPPLYQDIPCMGRKAVCAAACCGETGGGRAGCYGFNARWPYAVGYIISVKISGLICANNHFSTHSHCVSHLVGHGGVRCAGWVHSQWSCSAYWLLCRPA